jgi:hypothetical protein
MLSATCGGSGVGVGGSGSGAHQPIWAGSWRPAWAQGPMDGRARTAARPPSRSALPHHLAQLLELGDTPLLLIHGPGVCRGGCPRDQHARGGGQAHVAERAPIVLRGGGGGRSDGISLRGWPPLLLSHARVDSVLVLLMPRPRRVRRAVQRRDGGGVHAWVPCHCTALPAPPGAGHQRSA